MLLKQRTCGSAFALPKQSAASSKPGFASILHCPPLAPHAPPLQIPQHADAGKSNVEQPAFALSPSAVALQTGAHEPGER